MLNIDNNDEQQRLDIASRLKEAIGSLPRGGKVRIAEACDISPTAITGWIKNGRIDKKNIAIVANITGYDLNWLISGKGNKLAIEPSSPSQQKIELTTNAYETLKLGEFSLIPVVGTAQLGDNGHWYELEYPVGYGDGHIRYPSRDHNAYALRCVGDSMKPRIRDGEFVVVEPNREVRPGDDVVLKSLSGAVMAKTFLYNRDGKIYLQSINESHPSISIPLEEVDKIHPVAAIVNSALWVKNE